ncbi:unnamed protein product [Prorocentrum cordatum]|uniref:Uncharacterized protein n=1 Tax=Prorocentrum cordatum TaxID=2364126 RepID=A0ABN9T5R0_9DINO|nr:unnamed protein product [Polarella glacialis]
MSEAMELEIHDAPAWLFPLGKRKGEGDGGQASKTLVVATGGAGGGRGSGDGHGRGHTDATDGIDMATFKWVARQTLANSRAIADLEANVNDTFLLAEETWLAKAGLLANAQYTKAAADLKAKAASDPQVDTSSLGPPFLVVFFLVMSEIRKQAATGIHKEEVEAFWQTHIKDKTPAELAMMVRTMSFQQPRGEKSKRMEKMVKLRLHILTDTEGGRKLSTLIYRTLCELNAQKLVGSAPRSQGERAIQKWLSRSK